MASMTRRPNQQPARWDLTPDMQSLTTMMNRLLEGWGDVPPIEDAFIPAADVEETDDAFVIEVELPGIDKKDIDVELSGRRLTITGERKEKERTGVLRRRTRTTGRFRFELVLPADVDENSVDASLESGVLTVRVAKRASDQRHIEVK
jgi:HSP20 family protein